VENGLIRYRGKSVYVWDGSQWLYIGRFQRLWGDFTKEFLKLEEVTTEKVTIRSKITWDSWSTEILETIERGSYNIKITELTSTDPSFAFNLAGTGSEFAYGGGYVGDSEFGYDIFNKNYPPSLLLNTDGKVVSYTSDIIPYYGLRIRNGLASINHLSQNSFGIWSFFLFDQAVNLFKEAEA